MKSLTVFQHQPIIRDQSVFYNSVSVYLFLSKCVSVYISLTTIPASNNSSRTIVRVGESWREVGGIRGVSWIHCDAFHVELFVLPGGVQFGEPEDTTAGNPDSSATVSATKTPSGLADTRLGASTVSQRSPTGSVRRIKITGIVAACNFV